MIVAMSPPAVELAHGRSRKKLKMSQVLQLSECINDDRLAFDLTALYGAQVLERFRPALRNQALYVVFVAAFVQVDKERIFGPGGEPGLADSIEGVDEHPRS